MRQHCEYISGAANTVASSICWTQFQHLHTDFTEIIAYCIDNLVAIVDVSKSVVTETLRGHTGRINVLKATKSLLISASEDSTIRVWKISESLRWVEDSVLSGVMRSSIIALSCLDTSSGILIAASDVTGRLVLWLKGHQSDVFTVLQIIDMPPAQMPHDLHLTEVPGNVPHDSRNAPDILLFIGSVDTRIHMRIASQQSMRSVLSDCGETNRKELKNPAGPQSTCSSIFNLVGVLAGHEEWVTCLASMRADNRTLLLASGSKDTKIRLWRVVFTPRTSTASCTESFTNDFNRFNIHMNENEEEEEDDEDDGTDNKEGIIELEPDESLSEARLMFNTPCGKMECSIFLDALLIGHEDWVTSVHWMTSHSCSDSDINSSSSSGSRSGSVSNAPSGEVLRSENTMNQDESYRLYSTCMDRYVHIYTY